MSYFTSEMFLQETRQLMIWKGKQRLKGRAERKEGGERSDEEGPHRQPATMQEEREIILAPPATSQIPRTGPKLLRPPYNVEPLGQPNPHLYVCQKRDSSPIGSPPKYRLRLDEIASKISPRSTTSVRWDTTGASRDTTERQAGDHKLCLLLKA